MTSNLLRAIIIGAPASGKGTISSRVVKYFNIKHVSSGDILRLHILNKTDLGKAAEDFITKGLLVPDELMINLITNELKKLAGVNWLLDGFPRTKAQAEKLHQMEQVNLALNLVVPFEAIIHRVQQRWIHAPSGRIYNTEFSPPRREGKDDITGEDLIQRPDDRPEAVQKRLNDYSHMILPVIQFYEKLNIVHNFEGKTSNEIWPQVFQFLSTYCDPKEELTTSQEV